VNKSNIKYKDQLAVLCEEKVDFIITSFCLRRPSQAHKVGIKVFCDVTDLALPKVAWVPMLIAVNNLAGGHRGNLCPEELIKLNLNTTLPVISAGGQY
jgi:nitronate monooxygenase